MQAAINKMTPRNIRRKEEIQECGPPSGKKVLTGLVLMRNVIFGDFLSKGTTANSYLYISTLRSQNALLRP